MADGIALEQRGVLAAIMITDAFTASGNAMARRHGFPGYRYAMVPQPLSSLNEEQIEQRAREVLPELLSILGIADEIEVAVG